MLLTSSLGKIRLIKCMAANPIDNLRSGLDRQTVQWPCIGLPVKITKDNLCPVEWDKLMPRPI